MSCDIGVSNNRDSMSIINKYLMLLLVIKAGMVVVFNATFNNISFISWRSVLMVEEAGENHRQRESNFITCVASSVHPFV